MATTVTPQALETLRSAAHDEQVFGPAWTMMRELGVVREGHFWLNDHRHTPYYYDTLPLFLTGRVVTLIQDLPAAIDPAIRKDVTVVAGPQFGGDVMALLLAKILEAEGHARSVFSLPIEKKIEQVGSELGRISLGIRPYFQNYLKGAKVLLVDTVRSTDKTMKACEQLVTRNGGEVLASVSFIDAATVKHPRPHYALWRQEQSLNYAAGPQTCPMCQRGTPITRF